MSWKITPSNLLVDDADALAYLTAVETADTAAGQSGGLESGVRLAVNAFVKGCKADGIWPAIKASCILAGARTLEGALVPLVGTAPTSFNFVAADYSRKTGLVGDGSTKYLNSNRNNNTGPINNRHLFSYITQVKVSGSYAICLGTGQNSGDSMLGYRWDGQDRLRYALSSVTLAGESLALSNGGFGASRSSSSQLFARRNGANATFSSTSAASTGASIDVYRGNSLAIYAEHRMAFYSIGEALDLALLDSRVTDLINAIAAAIP